MTVLAWMRKGHLALIRNGLVVVAASERRLARRPEINRGGRAKGLFARGGAIDDAFTELGLKLEVPEQFR